MTHLPHCQRISPQATWAIALIFFAVVGVSLPTSNGSAWVTSAASPVATTRVASATLESDTLLLRLVGWQRLAAVSWVVDWPDYSPHGGQVPAGVPRLSGDLEQIVAVEPGLAVVADYLTPGIAPQLRTLGVKTCELSAPTSLTVMLNDLERLGRTVGTSTQAQAWSRELTSRIVAVRSRAAKRRQWRALVVDAGFALGPATIADDLLTHLHTFNPVRQTRLQGGVMLNAEHLLAWQPHLVFVAIPGTELRADVRGELAQIPGYDLLRWAPERAPLRVIGIPRALLSAVSPLAVDALELMDRCIEDLAVSDLATDTRKDEPFAGKGVSP